MVSAFAFVLAFTFTVVSATAAHCSCAMPPHGSIRAPGTCTAKDPAYKAKCATLYQDECASQSLVCAWQGVTCHVTEDCTPECDALNSGGTPVPNCLPGVGAAAAVGCTADDDCLARTDGNWRCLEEKSHTVGASPCSLDYKYNQSGYCGCQTQDCTVLNTTKTSRKKQLLVVGDSISNGYFGPLQVRGPSRSPPRFGAP